MKYTNLIWDFDGMLFNTYPRMTAAFQKALHEYSIDVPRDEVLLRIKRSVGKACADYSALYGIDRQALSDCYQKWEHRMPADTMFPYEGMGELLHDAVKAGRHIYLYTHRDQTALEGLERYGLINLFSGFVTALDKFPAKPAPDALFALLKRYHLKPVDSLMLGDRSIDILAARGAGLNGCLFDPEHFYDDFKNELRVHSVDELREVLKIHK